MAGQGTSGTFTQRRRLPVYLVMDHSAALQGTSMVVLNLGMQQLSQRSETGIVYLGLIAFADRVQKVTLAPIHLFTPLPLAAAGACALGAALKDLRQTFAHDLIRDTPERPGDYRPLVFVLLGGTPTDHWQPEAQQILQMATSQQTNIVRPNVVGIALRDPAETILKEITPVVLRTAPEPGRAPAITACFRWMGSFINEFVTAAATGAVGQAVQPPSLPTGVSFC